jgi:phosphomannomutase
VFTGNEIGALLAHWSWVCYQAARGGPGAPGASGANAWMFASTVSSRMIGAMAAAEGFNFQETLTGFKFMGNAMAAHEAAGHDCLFAFEEAIGFCCGSVVRDKDGIAAAAVFAEMANELHRREGLTVAAHLERLYARYGHFVSNNYYVFIDDPAKTTAIFARLRNGGRYWHRLGDSDIVITGIRDLTAPGYDSGAPDRRPRLPVSRGTQMLTFTFSNGVSATLRTSGTEPKLKYYCELAGADPVAARAELDRTVALIIDDMIQPEVHGLKRPVRA